MSSSASDVLTKAWEIYGLVLRYLTYAVVFVGGSSAVIYQLRIRFGLDVPDFGLTFLESTILWGVLATPFYMIAMFAIVMALSFLALFAYLSWLVLKHLPEIVGVVVEVWREQRNGS